MKKWLVLIFSVLVIFSCAVAVSAEEEKYNNAGELYEAWAENLPDFICGVWSTDGGMINLTFGIQNNEAGNAGKQKMLDLIKDDSTITFVYQQYSRNYLLRIQQEIDGYMQLDLGLISTGVDDIRNCVELGILEERKADAKTKAMIREITNQYGDAVAVGYTGEIVPTVLHETELQNRGPAVLLLMTLSVVTLLCVMFLVSQKKGLLLETRNGTTVAVRTVLTGKEVEALVKKSAYKPSGDLDARVMHAISEKK